MMNSNVLNPFHPDSKIAAGSHLILINDCKAPEEQTLQSSCERFELAVKASFSKIWDYDVIKKTVYCNEAFYNFFGERKSEDPVFVKEFVHREDAGWVEKEFISFLKSNSLRWNKEFRMIKADGSIVFVKQNVIVLRNNKNFAYRALGVIEDITERKEAEQKLADRELHYRTIFEQNLAGVYQTTLDGVIINCNEAFARMLKYSSREELMLTSAFDLYFAAVDREAFVFDIRKRKKLSNYESVLKCKDGSALDVIENIFLQTDPLTGEEFCQGIMIDISKRKQAEEKVLSSEKRFKSLVQNGTDLLAIIDPEGKPLYISPTIKKIMDYDPEFLIGKNSFDFIHEEDIEKTMNALALIATEKIVKVPLYRYKNYSGEWRWIESTITNMLDDPAICGIVVNSRDVTEKKELEEKFLLERINHQKQNTEIAIQSQEQQRKQIGRELHDNINQLLANAKMMLDSARNSPALKDLCIEKSYEAITLAIEETRQLSHSLVPPTFNDEHTFVDALNCLVSNINLTGKINVELCSPVRGTFKETDEKIKLTLYRIIQEQLTNILKHAKATYASVHLQVLQKAYELKISDNGIGFDTAKKTNGIGLRNIESRTELLSGTFKLTSEPGKGCTLQVQIPY